MSDAPTKPTSSPAEVVSIAVDIERAQTILHDIAVELRFVTFARQAAPLHVRALALKRDVAHWSELAPPEPQRLATIEELLELHERAKAERRKRR
jgi:hypothetical protein